MLSLVIFIFILGILIIVHEFGHFIAAKRIGVRVEQFSLGFGPKIFSRRKGHTEYTIASIPLGGFVKLSGDNLEEYKGKSYEYLYQAPGKRFQVIIAGPLLNYLLGFLLFWMIFFVGYPTLTTKVGSVIDGFGAKEVGLQKGDKILAIDGKAIETWEDMQGIIQDKAGPYSVKLSVLRADKEFKVDVPIREKEVDDRMGQKRSVGLLGITPFDEIIVVRHGFWQSCFLGAKKTVDLTILTYKGLWRVVTGRLSIRDSVTGPLGIFYITSKAASLGMVALLHLVAILSVSLALFNILPLPVLDGGYIFFLAIEKIRGKYMSSKAERVISQVGFTMIIAMALFVTYNDIVRHFGDKIAKIFIK